MDKLSGLGIGVPILLAALLLSVGSFAQVTGIPPAPRGTVSIPSGFIDTMSGQVHISIPIASIAQRGGPPLVENLVYDPQWWYFNINYQAMEPTSGGWQATPSSSDLGSVQYTLDTNYQGCPSGYSGYVNTYSNFYVWVYATNSHYPLNAPALMWYSCYSNGTRLTGQDRTSQFGQNNLGYSAQLNLSTTTGAFSFTAWDISGNSLTTNSGGYSGSTNGQTGGQFTTLPITQASCGSNFCLYVNSSDGTQQAYKETFQTISVSEIWGGTQYTGSVSLLSSLLLPDGTSYSFTYDTGTTGRHSGMLTGVTLPTGGQVTVGYQNTNTSGQWDADYFWANSATFGGGTWTLSPSFSTNGATVTTTVTAPARYDAVLKKNVNDQSVYVGGYQGTLTSATFYSGSIGGTPVKSITYAYGTSSCPSAVTMTNDAGQSATTQYQYLTPSGGNVAFCSLVTQEQEFDFGASSPTRTTKMSYIADTASIKYNSVYHIYDRPTSVSVYAGSGTGSPVSQTNYTYDEYSANYCSVPMLATVTGAVNHDDSGHGSSFLARGNVTTTSKLISGTTYVTSHKCYDTLGNVTQEVDAKGNATSYDYTDTWADTSCISSTAVTKAFPTTITDAARNRTKITRYTCTALTGATANENDIEASRSGTTYTYDWGNRPLCVNYPNGGQTCNVYVTSPFSSTQTTLITSSLSKTSSTILDGYGRVTQTQLTSDPSGTDYIDIGYDLLGRKTSVSNPYRSTSDLTYGVTNTYYDALGRVTSTVEPDGSTATVSYSGNTSTVTDEVGNKRKTQSDAMGRLTFAWEDPTNRNFETDYAYDPLNNLTIVTQKGGGTSSVWRVRTFTYDGLSRVVCAANPEVQAVTCPASATGTLPPGAVSYTYDANGNVSSKTSPLPNQSSASTTVSINYSYDTVNRLTKKVYTDGTATAQYGYDGLALTGCTIAPPGDADSNGKGHRTSMCDGSGATNWTHDTMGRILQERRTIGTVVGKYDNDAYNLDGSVSSITIPSGYQIGYTYNKVAQPITVKVYGTNAFNYVTSATYSPAGALTSASLGATPVTLTNTYNDRLQPILLSATTPSATLFSECFDFHLKVVVNASPCSFSASTGDNGNVYTIVNNRDNTRSQNFLYDSLNRIQQAYTSGAAWGETFGPVATAPGTPPSTPGIDAWGNMTNRSGVTGKTNAELFSFPALTNNQLSGFGYDAAGNMTSNTPATYVYDAENRLIAARGMSYLYDGDGKRVEKCTEGTTAGKCATGATGTLYWWGTGNAPQAETDLAGNVLENYVFLNGQRIARREPTNAVHFYFSNHLGSHAVVENAAGTTCEQDIDYYPYGGVEYDYCGGSGVSQHYKFTGNERDGESGLDNFEARYYGNGLGRFMSPDPLNLTEARLVNPSNTLNKYVYGGNNPLKYVDPDGKDITVFYERPSLFPLPSAGHILFTAYNQQTGDAAVMSFGPIRDGFTDAANTVMGVPVVSTSEFNLAGKTLDELRENYAALSIRTTPGEAQQIIDWINAHGGVEALAGGYMLYDQNCTTVCRDALKMVNKLAQGNTDWSPTGLWFTIFGKYARPVYQNSFGWTGSNPGTDYGQPSGYNAFQLLWMLTQDCSSTFTDDGNGSYTLRSTCH